MLFLYGYRNYDDFDYFDYLVVSWRYRVQIKGDLSKCLGD